MSNKTNIEKDIEILEDNYKILNEDVSGIAKELNLKEYATIDEIYTAIKILKSKRLNMFEILESNDKAKKYDKLIEKIKEIVKKLKYKDVFRLFEDILIDLQEILDVEEKENE
ncbi:MAG: hypothetical protein HFJ48_01620 [Clostridia bacterium]|nr:hypothetical protein [Clostridia bacterium]